MERKLKEEDIPSNRSLDDIYKIVKQIGHSFFSKVYIVKNILTNQKFAAKVISKRSMTQAADIKSMLLETHLLSTFDHPNIVKLIDYFQDENNFYMITELCSDGDILSFALNSYSLSESMIAELIKQILSVISYMNERNLVHCDLNPTHLLIAKSGSLKMVDFAAVQKTSKLESESKPNAYYTSPEGLRGNFCKKSDMWSCGVLLYTLLCGYPPFNGATDLEIADKVKETPVEFPKSEWDFVSPEAKNLVQSLLVKDPSERLDIKRVIKHTWIKRASRIPFNRYFSSRLKSNLRGFIGEISMKKASLTFIHEILDNKNKCFQIASRFRGFDIGNTGKVSVKEFREVIGSRHPDKCVGEDGMIDYGEFIQMMTENDREISIHNLEYAFSVIDVDNSGSINVEELKRAFGVSYEDDVWRNLIDEVDVNGDREIDLQEFIDMLSKET